jgi:hypothetical protein
MRQINMTVIPGNHVVAVMVDEAAHENFADAV